MRIEYYHSSKYGNGAMVAEEFRKQAESAGVSVGIHHVDEVDVRTLPKADMYIFSSPGRFGKPMKEMRRFLKEAELPVGSRCALLATELWPGANGSISGVPEGDGNGPCQNVIPGMRELLDQKKVVTIADTKVYVTGMKGPLEARWKDRVSTFVKTLAI